MRLGSFPDWATQQTAVTDAGSCDAYGIAIGPNSDEGAVNIGGTTLQAGRVLPIRGRSYAVTAVRPTDPALLCIRYLELVIFDEPHELAAAGALARPHHDYAKRGAGFPTTKPGSAQLSVPFVGRTQLLVQFSELSAGINYEIIGLRWNFAANAIERTSLAAAAVTPDEYGTYAIYVGGNGDETEVWDVIEIYGWAPSGAFLANIDTVACGEFV